MTPTIPKHNLFDTAKSKTFENLFFKIWYSESSSTPAGSPDVTVWVGIDDIDIGGLKINDQAIQLVDTYNKNILTTGCDGVLGLGFNVNNMLRPSKVQTPVDNIMTQHKSYLAQCRPFPGDIHLQTGPSSRRRQTRGSSANKRAALGRCSARYFSSVAVP